MLLYSFLSYKFVDYYPFNSPSESSGTLRSEGMQIPLIRNTISILLSADLLKSQVSVDVWRNRLDNTKRLGCSERASLNECLSCMTGNCHVQFLGGSGPETAPGYPNMAPKIIIILSDAERFLS